MHAIAALAAKEAAVASGFGVSLLPGIAPSAVDGFAAGTLLSGLCFLLVTVPKHGQRRSRLAAREGVWMNTANAPATTGYAGYGPTTMLADPQDDSGLGADTGSNPDDSAEMNASVWSPPPDEAQFPEAADGYHSRHRVADSAGERRAEGKRTAGRHAAPSAGIGSRVAGRLPFRPLTQRD